MILRQKTKENKMDNFKFHILGTHGKIIASFEHKCDRDVAIEAFREEYSGYDLREDDD